MASYEETLVNISLDANEELAVDTRPPYVDKQAPDGGTAVAGYQYRFLTVSGEHEVNLFKGEGVPVGVLQNKPQIEGMAATVAIAGISLVEAGGVIDAGVGVGSDANGRAVSGGELGITIYAAEAEGQLIPVLLRLTATALGA